MKCFLFRLVGVAFIGAFVASCDLQPKISSIPDGVGDFISARYPTLLADPETEPEIYNSAVTDYGVYESPDLYGSGNVQDYMNYASASDYVLNESVPNAEAARNKEEIPDNVADESDKVESIPETEPDDVLSVNDYVAPEKEDTPIKNDALVIPEKKIIKPDTVVVQKGDTLYAIAHRNGTTVENIAAANGLTPPYALRVGQELLLKKQVDTTKAQKASVVPQNVKKNETTNDSVQPKVNQSEKPKEKTASNKVVAHAPKTKIITVERGDTLYSLSRGYAIPVNDLAVMNNLRPPFDLRVGQSLVVPNVKRVAVPAPQKPEVKSEPKAETNTTPAKVATVASKTATAVPVAAPKKETSKTQSKPATKQPATDTKKQAKADVKKQPEKKTITEKPKQTKTETPAKKAETKKTTTNVKEETPKIAARSSSKFTWPVRGKILSHYGAKTGGLFNDGINVSAGLGTTVVAAENGVVAYAGNEVKGMGNLIIIQHEGGWMTVYAHLNSISVRRGARVTVGQKIGTVGQTGKVSQPQLHFEIRKGRKAYNPINYLKK